MPMPDGGVMWWRESSRNKYSPEKLGNRNICYFMHVSHEVQFASDSPLPSSTMHSHSANLTG
jgi:hypothetical protein